MNGGMTVTKTTTGVHLIRDIQVTVPHQEAVFISAEKVVNSKDLHRALNSRILFQLSNNMMLTPKTSAVAQEDSQALREALREALRDAHGKNVELQESLSNIQSQLRELTTLVRTMAVAPVVSTTQTPVLMRGHSAPTAVPATEVVGGDTPMFIPDGIVPADAEVKMSVKSEVSEGASVSEAASKLRELRRK